MIQSLKTSPLISTQKLTEQLFQVLQEIANKIEIKANFLICHPDYHSLEIPTEMRNRLDNLPATLQKKYLSLQLRTFIYGIYYNGSMIKDLTIDQKRRNLPLDLENNTFLGIDLDFYEQLHQSNNGEGYFDSGWLILAEEHKNSLVVFKNGLRLHIQRDIHLQPQTKNAQIGDNVAVLMPKNLLQNGFYMAVGNAGYQNNDSTAETVRIYFNLTPQGSIQVMESLTYSLNEIYIPFTFKVLYNPSDYERYDSGVLYFNKSHYQKIKPILLTIYQQYQEQFKPEIPLFTLQLASGLGLAEEPKQKFASQESFGMNRCQLVANGLLDAWETGDNSSAIRMEKILQQFSLLGLDWQRPYLNPNSEDIYH
jgi:hypothetical protein